MGSMCVGVCDNCICGARQASADAKAEQQDWLSKPAENISNQEVEDLKRALTTLKGIAQGYGTDPRIYAQNTLDELGVKY